MNMHCSKQRRFGMTMIECVVAAGVLMIAMGTVTTLAFRISRMWSQTGHQRIAMDELNNQLEQIIDAEPGQIDELLKTLQPSEVAIQSLDQPELSGIRVRDQLGDRIELVLKWRSPHPVAAVELTAWIDPSAVEVSP